MKRNKLQYFEMNYDEPYCGEFCKYSIAYSSEDYIAGKIFYNTNAGFHCEKFLLEPGENVTFYSYIDGYTEGECAWDFYRVEFKSLNKENAAFTLIKVQKEQAEKWTETVFAGNETIRIGVNLKWGGALSVVQDLQSIDDLPNLLNVSSPLNMIYKSYKICSAYKPNYVSSKYMEEYFTEDTDSTFYYSGDTDSYYNGKFWPYNPVQIGDQYGHHAKLVDYKVEKNTIYVKSVPMDFARNNKPVMGYIESKYTVLDDHIRVDTRFIDTSVRHSAHMMQTWPEMHVLSYLDCFQYYDGKNPWSKERIISKRNPGELDENNMRKSVIQLESGNTECWCAWTADKDGFGIGIYSPKASLLTPWQENYNASYDEKADSFNAVKIERMFMVETLKHFNHSFLIAVGRAETIRDIFTAHYQDINVKLHDGSVNCGDDVYDDAADGGTSILLWGEEEKEYIEDADSKEWFDDTFGGGCRGAYFTYDGDN